MSYSGGKFLPQFTLSVETGPYVPISAANGYQYFGAQDTTASGSLNFQLPLTVEFEIRREFLSSAQTATFRMLNLSAAHRKAIYHDRFAANVFQGLQFRAGYIQGGSTPGGFIPRIFNGNVRWAWSERRGVDWFTNIEAYDGGFAMFNSWSSQTFAPGSTLAQQIGALNGDLLKIYPTPILGTIPNVVSLRGVSLFGPTWKNLGRILPYGLTATIDDNQLKVLSNSDAITFGGDQVFVIEADTGLLTPPIRNGTMIELEILFEPRIGVGQMIQINSTGNPEFNGTYRVQGIVHRGRISQDVDAELTTHLSVWLGAASLTSVTGSTPT